MSGLELIVRVELILFLNRALAFAAAVGNFGGAAVAFGRVGAAAAGGFTARGDVDGARSAGAAGSGLADVGVLGGQIGIFANLGQALGNGTWGWPLAGVGWVGLA